MATFSSNLSADSRYSIALEVTEKSYSVTDNTSDVDYKLTATKSSGTGYYDLNANSPITVVINGSTVVDKKKAYDFRNSTPKTITLASGTVKGIAHNTDGKKSISVSASFTDASNSRGSASVSGTVTLTTIPRKTTPSLSATTVTMGNGIAITLKPADSSFKHKINYDFGSLKGQTSGISIGANFTAQGNTTVTFTPPTSLGSQVPNDPSGTCTIYCYTYNSSGTLIGTEPLNITLNVPNYTPVISNVTLTGNNLLSGEYVQGKSTVTGNATLTTSYGAGVKSVSIEVDGKTYTELPFTSSALSNGSKTVKITFTDTRSKSTTYTSSAFTVQVYSAPTISGFTLERQSNVTTVIATVNGSVAAVNNKNTKTITVTLNGVTNTITSDSYTINGTTTFTNVPTDNTLTATATISDHYFNGDKAITKNAVLPTVAATMDFHHSGTGVAFGKVAEQEDLLDVAWRIKNSSVPTLIGGLGTSIPSNANLNSTSYINPGNYVCPSNAIAQTVTNTPTKYAFKMCVYNITNSYADASNQWTYLVREITNYQGERWIQNVNKDSGSWVFSSWYLMINSSNIKDYVIEVGTTGEWNYTKWNGGKIELYCDKSLTFPEGTQLTTNLWRSIVTLDLSSHLKTILSGTCSAHYSGMLPQFTRHSDKLTTAEIIVSTSRTIGAFTITAPIYVIGKWK